MGRWWGVVVNLGLIWWTGSSSVLCCVADLAQEASTDVLSFLACPQVAFGRHTGQPFFPSGCEERTG